MEYSDEPLFQRIKAGHHFKRRNNEVDDTEDGSISSNDDIFEGSFREDQGSPGCCHDRLRRARAIFCSRKPGLRRAWNYRSNIIITRTWLYVTMVSNLCFIVVIIFLILRLHARKPQSSLQSIAASWERSNLQAGNNSDWSTVNISRDIKPIPCHSHNDYLREIPLYSALAAGCTGVEADIWLKDNDLLVGHSKKSLAPSRTLRSLYIDPLVAILTAENHNVDLSRSSGRHGVFAADTSTSVTLLVDFKTNGTTTYPVFLEQLEPLRSQGFLTRFNGSDVIPGPVTVVGTGNAPFDVIASESNGIDRDIFFDAPLDKLWGSEDGGTDVAKYTAQNSYYASVSFDKAIGKPWLGILSPTQVDKLRGQIREAKMRGLKSRYWSTPAWPIGLREHVWGILMREEVVRLTAASDDAVDAHTFDQMTNNHHLRLDERFTDLLEKYAKPD